VCIGVSGCCITYIYNTHSLESMLFYSHAGGDGRVVEHTVTSRMADRSMVAS